MLSSSYFEADILNNMQALFLPSSSRFLVKGMVLFWAVLSFSVITMPTKGDIRVTTQPEPGRIKQGWGTSVELTGFIHGNEKPWNNKYNTI